VGKDDGAGLALRGKVGQFVADRHGRSSRSVPRAPEFDLKLSFSNRKFHPLGARSWPPGVSGSPVADKADGVARVTREAGGD